MHQFDDDIDALAEKILEYSLARLKKDPPLDGPWSYQELYNEVGETITPSGLGGQKTLDIFKYVLASACISTDHPRNLAFIPSAPTETANLFDLVVGASSIYGGSWKEGAGAIFAENQAIRWISDLAGFPKKSGGVFVQGGTIGNLSALVVARAEARKKYPDIKKWVIACSKEAHSSIKSAAEVMDVGVLTINTDENYKITKKNASRAIIKYHEDNKDSRVFAIIATAGTTNLGVIDDLKGIGELSKRLDIWYHIDGAYGLAALASPKSKELFKGVELADSFIVDPHKWLFAPFDACALIYREPELARETHTQHAGYLKILDNDEWNPSDYAIQLTRRVRGLPFWFSLAVHGTDKYAESIDKTMLLAKESARLIKDNPNLELIMEPELSIVAFKKIGWREEDYQRWSDKLLNDQLAFVTPSDHDNETILRFAIVNPWTNITDIKIILATL